MVAFSLVVMMSLFSIYQYVRYRRMLYDRLTESATLLGKSIEAGMQHILMTRNMAELQSTMEGVASQEDVIRAFVIDHQGEVRFAGDTEEIGQQFDIQDPIHQHPSRDRRQTVEIHSSTGERVFRTVTPVRNRPGCYPCHNPEEEVLGALITELSVERISRALSSDSIRQVVSVFGTIGTIALILGIGLDRKIFRRLSRLSEAMHQYGETGARRDIGDKGEDEIGDLVSSFNEMMEQLEHSQKALREQETRLARGETLRQMLVTLSHHINNAIGIIFGRAELYHFGDVSADELAEACLAQTKRISAVLSALEKMEREVDLRTTDYAGLEDGMFDIEEELKRMLEEIPSADDGRWTTDDGPRTTDHRP